MFVSWFHSPSVVFLSADLALRVKLQGHFSVRSDMKRFVLETWRKRHHRLSLFPTHTHTHTLSWGSTSNFTAWCMTYCDTGAVYWQIYRQLSKKWFLIILLFLLLLLLFLLLLKEMKTNTGFVPRHKPAAFNSHASFHTFSRYLCRSCRAECKLSVSLPLFLCYPTIAGSI